MLLLLGPRYSATDEEVMLLAGETGLSTYDLRMRLRPGAWSVIRAIADPTLAEGIANRLVTGGLQCCALEVAVGADLTRRIVYLRSIDVNQAQVTLRLAEREMAVPVGALLTIVRGDVHLGRTHYATGAQSSVSALRAAVPTPGLLTTSSSPPDLLHDQRGASGHEVFVAADLHFVTVPWLARIDARSCVIQGQEPDSGNYAERLDRFIDELAEVAQLRIDRDIKISNLASHTTGPQRHYTPSSVNGPISTRRGSIQSDEYFDAYSRMIGEAERRTLAQR